MSMCTYAGQEYSEGSVICQGGRLMKCQGGNWGDTGASCSNAISEEGYSKISEALGFLNIKRVDMTPADARPVNSTWFAALELLSENSGMYYGPWNNSFSSACVNTGFVSVIARDAMTRPPEVVGTCSGYQIVMVETQY
ncbi:DUF1496 domain-containing protein [Pseudoduganella albidiflava]|nr:DUF1496 domain-containing protein [Pseudoduganella albidiflava]GGY35865.1 hypothetical protein GCM10007387_17650 [Pseudoduganella albidiflava]